MNTTNREKILGGYEGEIKLFKELGFIVLHSLRDVHREYPVLKAPCGVHHLVLKVETAHTQALGVSFAPLERSPTLTHSDHIGFVKDG